MNGSKPGELAPSDFGVVLKSAGWTLLAAIAAAALTALADTLIASTLPELRDRGLIDVTLFTLLTTVIDAVRKAVKMWLTDTRMVGLLAFACLVLSGPLALAEEVAVLIDDSKPGTYLLTVGADGRVSAVPLRVVRPGQSPSPPTDPSDPPSNPTAFSGAVATLTKAAIADGASPTTAAGLSSVYSLVAGSVRDGTITEAQSLSAIKVATDTVMANVDDAAKWKSWREKMSAALEELRQQGVLKIPSAFDEVSAGIDSAIGKKIDPLALIGLKGPAQAQQAEVFEALNIDLFKLIELIMAILEFFKTLKGQ